jgi:AraC-like DNA-binding protein
LLNEALLVGAAQGLLLSAVILSLRSANPAAKAYLALFVGLESLHLFFLHLIYKNSGISPNYWLRLMPSVRILSAPALYFYVCAMTEHPFRLWPRVLKHLWIVLPVIAFFAYLPTTPGWLTMSTIELQHQHSTMWWSSYQSLVVVGYGLLALRQLHRHIRDLEQALSAIESVGLTWLRWLIVAIIAVHTIHIGADLLRFFDLVGPQPKIVINLVATLLLIYLLSIGGLRQAAVFTEPVRTALATIHRSQPEPPKTAECDAADNGKYVKSGLDDTRIGDIWQRLQQLLDSEHAYLDPSLDLPKLSRQLGVRPQELSQVINTSSGGSFYQLINHRRIEAAKVMLGENGSQKRKMLDIALSVGFSNQSTFYSQFKKLTGVTPTIYRDTLVGV